MKRKLLLLLLTILSVSGLSAQSLNGDLDRVMLEQADAMGQAFVTKDYSVFIKYAHPDVVAKSGGRDKMLTDIATAFGELEAEGVKFLGIKFGEPSKIITEGKEMQCLVSQMIEMRVPAGKLTASTTLIAVSQDEGKNWYFIDTSGNNITNLRMGLPNLSPRLDLPMPRDPVFEPNEPGPQPE